MSEYPSMYSAYGEHASYHARPSVRRANAKDGSLDKWPRVVKHNTRSTHSRRRQDPVGLKDKHGKSIAKKKLMEKRVNKIKSLYKGKPAFRAAYDQYRSGLNFNPMPKKGTALYNSLKKYMDDEGLSGLAAMRGAFKTLRSDDDTFSSSYEKWRLSHYWPIPARSSSLYSQLNL